MCVIVHQPEGAYLRKDVAKRMFKSNPDGAGFAFINDEGNIEVIKTMTFESFWSHFETARSRNRDKAFLIHFRIATSGKVGLDNTHPFQVDEHTVMAHNGMLNQIVGSIPITAELSDTREFVESVLPWLPEDWLDNPVLFEMMEEYIGYSKLMFLTTNPALKKNVYILNKDLGVKEGDMWWSNGGYKSDKEVAKKWGKGNWSRDWSKPSDSTPMLPLRAKEIQETCDIEWDDDIAVSLVDRTEPEAIAAARRQLGLGTTLVYDPMMEEWECQICFEYVDEDGGCNCWEQLCVACGRLAPYCLHDFEDAEFVDVKEAWKTYQEKEGAI